MTISSCSSVEVDRVEKHLIAYDQSPPLPQNSGVKVRLDLGVPGLLFQPGIDPSQVEVSPGTYVLLGVEVYRRMYAAVSAIKSIQSDLTNDQRRAFISAQQEALRDLDKE
jgi:hypothetical protein